VDALTDDRGQALIVAVLALGIAAVAIVGLRDAQDRILADVRELRAGEAAVEAAAAQVSDDVFAFGGSLEDEDGEARRRVRAGPTRQQLERLLADPLLADRARSAADAIAAANGAVGSGDIDIRVAGNDVEVRLTVGRHRQAAALDDICCPH